MNIPSLPTSIDGIQTSSIEEAISLGRSDLAKFEAAWKAKNYASAAEITLEDVATVCADAGVPYAGIAKFVIPYVFLVVEKGKPITDKDPNYNAAAGNGNVAS